MDFGDSAVWSGNASFGPVVLYFALAPTLSHYSHRLIGVLPIIFTGYAQSTCLCYSTTDVDQSDALLLCLLISPPSWPKHYSGGAKAGAHNTDGLCETRPHLQYICLALAPNFQGLEAANGGPLVNRGQGLGNRGL